MDPHSPMRAVDVAVGAPVAPLESARIDSPPGRWIRTGPGRRRRRDAAGLFLGEFVRAPLRTASLIPSSPDLAEVMVQPLHRRTVGGRAQVVVELGAGTGTFTAAVRRVVPPGSRQVAVEINPAFAAHLRVRCPAVEVIEASAADLPAVLRDHDIGAPDLIVSGLPWQCYHGPAGPALIESIAAALRPDGVFTQFTYAWTRCTPPARRQHQLLQDTFTQVEVSGTIWRNLPPAFVYTCRTAPSFAS